MDWTKIMEQITATLLPIFLLVAIAVGNFIAAWFNAKKKAIENGENRVIASGAVLAAADHAELSGDQKLDMAIATTATQAGISLVKAEPLARAAFQEKAADPLYPQITNDQIRQAAEVINEPPEVKP